MNLNFNTNLSKEYKSKSQIARILTEDWISNNQFCPRCGEEKIKKDENNKPVSDFYCESCNNIFELKSRKRDFGKKMVGGAYKTMIERITSDTNPDFMLMTYNIDTYSVENLIIIPKFFFTPNIVIKRKPLSEKAVRSGWTGCNIDLTNIPEEGKIYIIKSGKSIPKQDIIDKIQSNRFIFSQKQEKRAWILDIMMCVEKIESREFKLSDMYKFEDQLHELHPDNNKVKDKIRQQLQILRDNGKIEFLGKGNYIKKG